MFNGGAIGNLEFTEPARRTTETMAHVLIVDDSPTDVHAMRNALEEEGYEVSVADSASAGLETAKTRHPDLILMDVVFQGMSGFQVTRRLVRDPETSNIPVVLVSSKDQESDRLWGLRQGAAEYLVKPIKAKVLLRTITEVLSKHGAQA